MKEKRFYQISYAIIILGYILWVLYTINKGVDLTDSSYLFSLYKNAFIQETTRSSGIEGTVILGGLIWNSLSSYQVLITRIVATMLVSVGGILIWIILRKYANGIILLLMVLTGCMLSLSWVHDLNYNTWSFFFLSLEIFLLHLWLNNNKSRNIILCGIIFGVNIWFRLPNVCHGICLISIIWYIINDRESDYDKRKKMISGVLLMCASVVVSFFITMVLISPVMGIENMTMGILTKYVAVTNRSEPTGHNFWDMIYTIKSYYIAGAKSGGKYLSILLVYSLLCRIVNNRMPQLKKNQVYKRTEYCFAVAVGFFLAVIAFNHFDINMMLSIIVFCATISGIIGAIYWRKKNTILSTLCFASALLELILKLGTNNGVFYNVVFMTMPICVIIILLYYFANNYPSTFFVGCLVFLSLFFVTKSIEQSMTYVYRDASYKELNTFVDVEEYYGMKTSKQRANMINKLETQLGLLPSGYIITMGRNNIAYVISENIPAVGSWVDLSTYSYESFEKRINECYNENKNPYIVFFTLPDDYSENELDKMKYKKLKSIIEQYQYKMFYEDKDMKIYVTTQVKNE